MREFELFTNTEAMRAVFQERLPGFSTDKLVITACHVLRTRYKTYVDERRRHRSFLFIHYELEIADVDRQSLGVQQLYAKAYLNGRSRLKFGQINMRRLCQPHFGEALVHLPDLDLIVWAFPNDPQLLQLPVATDKKEIKPYFPYVRLPAGFDGPEDVVAVKVEVVRYKPEVRCTIRYHLYRKAADAPQTMTLYGKTYATDKGREIYCQIASLWQQSRSHSHHFIVAQPFGYDETLQMVWQEALPGALLSDVLSAANYAHFLRLTARGLAKLHQSALTVPTRMANQELLARIGENTAELMEAWPEFKEWLERLLAEVTQDEPGLTPYADELVHCDFHVKQLLVHEDRLAIFDFDDLAMGDPLQDIAFFLVDLYFRDFEPPLVRLMADTFCQAYESCMGRKLPADRLRWHMRLQFLAKAHWFYKKKQLAPRLKAHIRRIIGLVES